MKFSLECIFYGGQNFSNQALASFYKKSFGLIKQPKKKCKSPYVLNQNPLQRIMWVQNLKFSKR